MPPLIRDEGPAVNARLATNLFDLSRMDPFIRQMLTQGHLDLQDVVWVDRNRPDETAVPFTCPILQAACIIDMIRSEDRKLGQYPTRAYIYRKAWSKLPGNAVLVLPVSGGLKLNPAVFNVIEAVVEASPPTEIKPVTF